ncbi:energy-coupled thiamine transporter ThiT [Murdochiella massiliensis]|uniref:energy-coupled thiamine transporter ThiT n=1 Tax=Murdochiella massiliensis TaxID=1673723 RepID=UPI00082BCFF4|nr:energy-coupled thiamine transporter ThiT [Murdochiella massiliensis]
MSEQTLNMPSKNGFSTRMVAEAGVMIALAKSLSFIKLFEMPMGGSVTLASMAPVLFFAIRWGWQKGLLVGLVYGLVDYLLGGYTVHPLQVLLDYPLAYMMLGFAGLQRASDGDGFFSHLPSLILAVALRLAMHVLSGCVFYSTIDFTKAGASLGEAFTLTNMGAGFMYSLQYNAAFLGVDFLICLVVLALAWQPLRKRMHRV